MIGCSNSVWSPPPYPYKSATIKGLIRMLSRKDIRGALGDPHWLTPDEDCELYCYDCANKALTAAREKAPNVDVMLGGDPRVGMSEDWAAGCHTCNVPLEVYLTEAGIEHELERWESDESELRTLHDYAYLFVLLQSGEEWYAWKRVDARRDRLLRVTGQLLGICGDRSREV